MDKEIIYFIIGVIFEHICSLSVEPIRKKWRRQCNYDCTKCKVWDCDFHRCVSQEKCDLKKRNKIK